MSGETERAVAVLRAEGFRRMAYTEWTPAAAGAAESGPVTVCVHGLTRNGRDFDPLAAALAGAGRRVLCPDVLGRGRSDRLADPSGYGYPGYMGDMAALIARSGADSVDWVGTSMGGLIGMFLAAMPGSPIRRLVLVDVGPVVPKAAMERIKSYVGTDPRFDTLADLEADLRERHATFGELTDAQWRHLAEHGGRPAPEGDGRLAFHYDPAIAVPFADMAAEDVVIWPQWEAVRCPVLVVRGAESDLLLADTAAEMRERGPKAEVVEIPGVGHAPALMDAEQIAIVREWLERG